MNCTPNKNTDQISTINKWVSAINFAVGKEPKGSETFQTFSSLSQ